MSARSVPAAQITRNLDRYEADWRAMNPGREPGPGLRRGWDARVWADGRPDKAICSTTNSRPSRTRWIKNGPDADFLRTFAD
jgi:hypothetical protein